MKNLKRDKEETMSLKKKLLFFIIKPISTPMLTVTSFDL